MQGGEQGVAIAGGAAMLGRRRHRRRSRSARSVRPPRNHAAKAPGAGWAAARCSRRSAGAADAPQAADQTAWNQDVSNAPVDPHSADYIQTITALGGNQSIHPDFGGNGAYGIPYTIVGAHQRRYPVHVDAYGDQSDIGALPDSAGRARRGRIRPARAGAPARRCKLFELYAAHFDRCRGHRWEAGSGAIFNLRSSRPSAPRRLDVRRRGGAADPSRPRPLSGEVEQGAVHHAIRVTFEETRGGLHPPRHPLRLVRCDPRSCRRWACDFG